MKNIKVYINKFIALALTSTLVITTSGCSGKNNKISTLEKQTFNIENTKDTIEDKTEVEIEDETEVETQTIEQPTTVQSQTIEQPTTVQSLTPQTNIESENEVIAFFENISNKVNTWIQSERFEDIKDDVTQSLATFILFLSNDSTIGGYTFSSLTAEGKEKVKILFISMDTKLEQKFPSWFDKSSENWCRRLSP